MIGIVAAITVLVMVIPLHSVSVDLLLGPAIGTRYRRNRFPGIAAAAIISLAAPAIQGGVIGVFNAVKNSAPAFGRALKW